MWAAWGSAIAGLAAAFCRDRQCAARDRRCAAPHLVIGLRDPRNRAEETGGAARNYISVAKR